MIKKLRRKHKDYCFRPIFEFTEAQMEASCKAMQEDLATLPEITVTVAGRFDIGGDTIDLSRSRPVKLEGNQGWRFDIGDDIIDASRVFQLDPDSKSVKPETDSSK